MLARIALVLSLLLGVGCRPPEPTEPPPVLLVGVDGLEWSVLLPLLADGELPVLGELMSEGTYGLLASMRPTFSPILWTTIATGKPPAQHGIRGFVLGRREDGTRRLYTSRDRRTKALWNLLSDNERRVAVVGWWNTFPAESVTGVVVSQVHTLEQAHRSAGQAILKGGLKAGLDGQVFPPERSAELLAVAEQASLGLDRELAHAFAAFRHPLPPLEERLWQNTRWAFANDAAYLAIGERLAEESFDLLMVYIGGADVVSHRFWRYREPEAYSSRPSPDQLENFESVIGDYYRYVDRRLGGLIDAYPRWPAVVIVSDHGMQPVNLEKPFTSAAVPKDINSAHHHGAPAGVWIAAGPGLQRRGKLLPAEASKGDLAEVGSVLDVTPTILALLGLPAGEDMPGRVLEPLLSGPPPRRIATYETSDWRQAAIRGLPGPDEAARLEQLRALGYIE